jgi:N-acetylglucosaminyldiphosphoundecaprenol N-acetyl-beta-D-mannosaminyltransferase
MTTAHLEVSTEAPARRLPAPVSVALPSVTLLGVRLTNAERREAVGLIGSWIEARPRCARALFIANAHTLNLAWDDPDYRRVLNAGDAVFGDGTGVRLAARLRGVRMRDNLVGTDLLPLFFHTYRQRRYRYFLLGGAPGTAARAATRLRDDFPGIQVVGEHHGYLDAGSTRRVIAAINAAQPDVLLVAMGNPTQERWIYANLAALRVPVSIGVGGLFDHWAGNLRRASATVRRLGMEWVQLLIQQPHKWRRYINGNPKFVARAVLDARRRRHPDDAAGRCERRSDETARW